MQKFLILLIIFAVIIAGLFYLYSENKSDTSYTFSSPSPSFVASRVADWQTYTNTKNGYSIQYPSDWVYRQYPDTETGAGFQPKSMKLDPANEFITINVMPKVSPEGSFSNYVKVAATNEIQGYQSIESLTPFTTPSNLTGYTTTWNVAGLGANSKLSVSNPITYFDLPDSEPPSTLQIFLNDPKYLDIYTKMLSTVTIQ
jgi:uncharacterized protein YxeA